MHEPEVVPFAEAWQATALGLVEGLKQAGVLSAQDWAEALGAEIAAMDQQTEAEYYRAVLLALERLIQERGLIEGAAVFRRMEEWRAAYLATPHGQPVLLQSVGPRSSPGR